MKHQCSLCGNNCEIVSMNCFGFKYLCHDCNTVILIRYNPGIYTFEWVENEMIGIINRMKLSFADI